MKATSRTLFILLAMVIATITLSAQPAPPDSLKAALHSGSMTSVTLTWQYTTTPAGNVTFNVYRKAGTLADTTTFKKIASGVRSKSFEDGHLAVGVYTYQVTAKTSAGESTPSNAVEVTIAAPTPVGKAVVTGVITDEATGLPLNHAYVNVFSTGRGGWNIGYTDSLGNYKIKVKAGEYGLYTSAHGYVPEYWDNVATYADATLLTLAANDSVNYNVALTAVVPPVTHTLSGTVKDAAGNAIKASVRFFKVKNNSRFSPAGREIKTDSLGNFTATLKENDTVVVYAFARQHDTFLPQYYNNKTTIEEADRIAISGDITGINFILAPVPVYPNSVAGQVKDTTGLGVESMVHAIPRAGVMGHGKPRSKYVVHTDSLGNYSFANFKPGQYIFLATPISGYKPSYFKYDGSSTMNWRNADSVVIDSASAITGINITVQARSDSGFANVVGRIRDNKGNLINGAYVYAIGSDNTVYDLGVSNVNGRYNIAGLVPDTYTIVADKVDYTSAISQNVVVSYSSATNSIDFVLTAESVTAVEDNAVTVSGYELSQNYPNPFNPTTKISYQIPVSGNVTLKVYNTLGKEVAKLASGFMNAGSYSIVFNASNLSSGVYFYKLEAGSFSAIKKLVLLK